MVLKSKLNGKNKITVINAWTVSVFRYGTGMLQWKESELKDTDRKSMKTKTMYGVTAEERCGQIVHKEERRRKKSGESGTLR